jgi:hypothetical protein
MSGNRCSAYISHPEHACINPQPARFDSFAGPLTFGYAFSKNGSTLSAQSVAQTAIDL